MEIVTPVVTAMVGGVQMISVVSTTMMRTMEEAVMGCSDDGTWVSC